MIFCGQIEDAFLLKPSTHVALMLTHIDGMPAKGMQITIAGKTNKILDLGKNSTDGQPVSYRDCLTGRPVPGYGAIAVSRDALPEDLNSLRHQWVEEAKL